MEYDESVLVQRSDDEQITAAVDEQMTFHCAQCNTVLSDSFSVCGEVHCLDSIMCLRVTNDVIIADTNEFVRKGDLANCVYRPLKCCDCGCTVGKVILSAPAHLAAVRSLFLLRKANINCYILNSSSMVKASTLMFDMKPLSNEMDKVRQQFNAQMNRMICIKSKLADCSMASEQLK